MEYVYVVVVGGVVGCSPQGAAMTTPAATKVQPVSDITVYPRGGRNKARREFDLNLGEIKFYYYIIRFFENSD